MDPRARDTMRPLLILYGGCFKDDNHDEDVNARWVLFALSVHQIEVRPDYGHKSDRSAEKRVIGSLTLYNKLLVQS